MNNTGAGQIGILKGKSVLLVDDAADSRWVLRTEILKRLPGVSVVESESGMKAAVELARHKFDLVVSDLDMEDGNGFWLHCFVSEYHTSTPLVFFTGDPEKASQLTTSRKVFDKLKIDSLFDEVKAILTHDQDIGGI